MPRGNGQGPANQGPRTGRGMGCCSDQTQPGFLNEPAGCRRRRRMRGRRGMGRGMGRFWSSGAELLETNRPQEAGTIDEEDCTQQESE